MGPAYPIEINEFGESYGSSAGLPPEDYPDLIVVVDDRGNTGYIRSVELRAADGSQVSNPEEAAAFEANRSEVSPTLIIYDKDGRTVLGE